MLQIRKILTICIALFSIWACSDSNKNKQESQSMLSGKILAQVGDRIITVDEFIRRAEYTVRPSYCHDDSPIHKKIILNSLIAEKLMMMDLDNHDLDQNFTNYLIGRKEQKMRELLYKNEGYDKAVINDTMISKVSQWAMRNYKIHYFAYEDSGISDGVLKMVQDGLSFNEIYNGLFKLDSIPIRNVDYFQELDPTITTALFTKKLQKDEIVGPIKTLDGSYLLMQIKGWTSTVPITNPDQRSLASRVGEKLKSEQANLHYTGYAHKIMQGKSMKLNAEAFNEFSNMIEKRYRVTRNNQEETAEMMMWQKEITADLPDEEPVISFSSNSTILEFDGQNWDVKDLEALIKTHPLVFRKKNIAAGEFSQQLKFAIADLFRDHFLTMEAYKKNLDKDVNIIQDQQMWSDSYKSIIRRNQLLNRSDFDSTPDKSYLKIINESLNPFVNSLQEKYSDSVLINFEEFDKLRLTSIDMFAISENVPYPVIVPDFPLLTTDHNIDYGKSLENK